MEQVMEQQARGLTYPCSYPVKVFIRPDAEVEQRLQALVRERLAADAPLEIERRASSTGKYVCLTLVFTAEDESQLMGITGAISADPGVVLAL
jgi:putative lipoic acid-binding regulatory protein